MISFAHRTKIRVFVVAGRSSNGAEDNTQGQQKPRIDKGNRKVLEVADVPQEGHLGYQGQKRWRFTSPRPQTQT